MRGKKMVLATILALVVASSAARGADIKQLEHVLDQWAAAWSSSDVDKVLPLFTDDVVYEDVTFGSVNHGRRELHDFAKGTFEAFADLKFELKSRVIAADGKSGAMEWIWQDGKSRICQSYQQPISLSRFGVRASLNLPTERSVETRTIGI
jgi:uncharacterized protein (TIGR02246 family)